MNKLISLLVPCALAAGMAVPASADDGTQTRLERGRYLVTIMDCTGCHTGGALAGKADPARFLAGSEVGFGGPQGVVYPPNLTPDRETGLGQWTDQQVADAIRFGRRPDGRALSPAMPWPSYSRLTDEDAAALVAYLRTIPAVSFQAPAPSPAGTPAGGPYLTMATGQ